MTVRNNRISNWLPTVFLLLFFNSSSVPISSLYKYTVMPGYSNYLLYDFQESKSSNDYIYTLILFNICTNNDDENKLLFLLKIKKLRQNCKSHSFKEWMVTLTLAYLRKQIFGRYQFHQSKKQISCLIYMLFPTRSHLWADALKFCWLNFHKGRSHLWATVLKFWRLHSHRGS